VDDLNTPLGQKPDRRNARWKPLLLPAVTVVLGVLVVGALAWIAFVDDPLGGEPIATAKIEIAAGKDRYRGARGRQGMPRNRTPPPANRP
jgi:hypothetical protein